MTPALLCLAAALLAWPSGARPGRLVSRPGVRAGRTPVAVLAGRGGEGLVGNLREAAGLDDLDLTTDEEGNVSVRAGRYLSRNLYSDVEVDAEGRSRINLNLDVNNAITARGSVASDGESTLGVFYERDY